MSQSPSQHGVVPSPESLLVAYGLSSADLERVAALGREKRCDPEGLVSDFYDWLSGQVWHQQFFSSGVPGRVKAAQVRHWRRFLGGRVDEAYVADRLELGRTHARIDLPPDAFGTAVSFSRRWLSERARECVGDDEVRAETVSALAKLCELDAGLVMGEYFARSRRRLEAEAARVQAINTETERVIVEAANGAFNHRYRPQGEDEQIASALNEMLDVFEATIEQVDAVVAGDFSRTLEPKSEDDALGHALANMTCSLRDARAQTELNDWMRDGQTELFERLRGELEPSELSRRVLEYVCPRVAAPVGVIYGLHEQTLLRSAAFGVHVDDVQERLQMGQGPIGEAALRKTAAVDLDISAHPVKAPFGLGSLELPYLRILPLVADERLCGVLELASAEPLSERSKSWLSMVLESMAIALDAAESRQRMGALLTKAEAQGEELRAQAEELRASNEELVTAREALEARNEDLRRQQLQIEAASTEIEQRAAELDRASQYKSEFLANISHELRTPLNSMLLITEGLVGNPEGNLSAHQLEALRLVKSGGQDLLRIISDILDLSKVEAGYLKMEPEDCSVKALVESLEGLFGPMAKASSLELRMHVADDVPSSFVTDGHRVEQVLKNLIGNAIKFTPEGSVSLEVRRGAPGWLAFSVRDTGIGIPQTQTDAIFEAFRQVDGSSSRAYGGTGLGLTISRQLTELLGGRLAIESEEGQGSMFTLELPLEGTSPQAAPPDRARTRPPAPKATRKAPPEAPRPVARPTPPRAEPNPSQAKLLPKLLVAEDDPTFAQTLAELARKGGYEPVLARTGKEALLLAEREQPLGILLDLGLPDLDGMRVLEQLKSSLQTRHIPVHVISGHECRAEVLQLGAIGFLPKPIEQAELEGILERFHSISRRHVGKVLVVEDDEATRFAIRSVLSADQLELVMVSSGAEALEAVAREDLDCIVLDLGLPDMSGQELLDQLPENHPPIVVYTASDPSDEKLDELAAHTKQVILKGARSPERLLDEVSLFLHQVESQLSQTQRETLQQLYDPAAALRERRVLIVDDDMRNVFALTHLLQQQGMEVLQAKNGEVALEKLDQYPEIDLVVTDIMMPVMDGYELIRRVRTHPDHADIPIIAVTAKSLPEDRDACLTAGATDYISKPMAPSNLLSLMRVLLYSGREPVRGS